MNSPQPVMCLCPQLLSVGGMKRNRPSTTALGGAGAALLLLLAACGFGTAQAHSAGPSLTTRWHLVAQCFRANGYPNLPDPTIDSHGQPQLPDGVQKPATIPTPCQSLLDQANQASEAAGGGGIHQPSHNVAQLRLFAQCMRDHGLDDWPDPDSQGRFHLPADLQGKSGPRWPAIRAAWSGPCAQFDTGGSIDVVP
jgi:hypothetical protein